MVKFADENPEEATEETPEVTTEETPEDETMITYREPIVSPDGTVGEKVHGPMPRADWAAYEKEHKL